MRCAYWRHPGRLGRCAKLWRRPDQVVVRNGFIVVELKGRKVGAEKSQLCTGIFVGSVACSNWVSKFSFSARSRLARLRSDSIGSFGAGFDAGRRHRGRKIGGHRLRRPDLRFSRRKIGFIRLVQVIKVSVKLHFGPEGQGGLAGGILAQGDAICASTRSSCWPSVRSAAARRRGGRGSCRELVHRVKGVSGLRPMNWFKPRFTSAS